MRIAIGGILHETSTFSNLPTTLDDFMLMQRLYAEGDDLIRIYTGTRSAPGGFIDAGRDAGFEIVPIMRASAVPGGPVTAEATRVLTDRLTTGLAKALGNGRIDGILLDLHGAMVSELDDDGERYILRAVRAVVGTEMPVFVVLDLHGNVSQEMIDLATVTIAYDEYPHTDPYDRGYELGLLLARTVRGEIQPKSALIRIPLMAGLQRQHTHADPMLGVKRLAHEIEAEPGILNVSYLPGFAWADIPQMAFSVIATADGDFALARAAAARVADRIWSLRDEFLVRPVPVDEAVRHAMAATAGPFVLADIGDNPGGGAPADGTILLEALLRHGARRAAMAIVRDPESVQSAFTAGVDGSVSLLLGGKTDDLHGSPLPVNGRVLRLTDGAFVNRGPMGTGVPVSLGPTAVFDLDGAAGGSVQVVVTTHRYQPTDLEIFRSQGIEPTEQQILAVKSSVHFRAAFTPIAEEILEVDTPGLTSPHLDRLDFRRVQRPIFPFDPDMTWQPG